MVKHPLLDRPSVILDIETTSLTRGLSGITEVGVIDLNTRKITEYILEPNLVLGRHSQQQDQVKLSVSKADLFEYYPVDEWHEVFGKQGEKKGVLKPKATADEVMAMLKKQEPFAAKAHEYTPHLRGEAPTLAEIAERKKLFAKFGMKVPETIETTAQKLLSPGGELAEQLRGKIVWIANAPFESSMVGAHLQALDAQGVTGPSGESASRFFKRGAETQGTSAAPMYVTGKEVTAARTLAKDTGDWVPVWKAYNKYLPAAGETAYRDILDLLRSLGSYGKQLGVNPARSVEAGVSINTAFQLLASTEPQETVRKRLLGLKEIHRAAEDAALHELYVLERSVELNQAAQDMLDKTPMGLKHLKQAGVDSGPLVQIRDYFARQAWVERKTVEEHAAKRLADAQLDILEYKKSEQTLELNTRKLSQVTPSGEATEVSIKVPVKKAYLEIKEVAELMGREGRYPGIDIGELRTELSGLGGQSFSEQRANIVAWRESKLFTLDLESAAKVKYKPQGILTGALEALGKNKTRALGGFAIAAGGLTALGFLWGNAPKAEEERPQRLMAGGYDQWLKYQQEYGGQGSQQLVSNEERQFGANAREYYGHGPRNQSYMDEGHKETARNLAQYSGMNSSGVSGSMRKRITDFGSPYRGPVGSQTVFANQELLAEREKWLRQQYTHAHYDPEIGLHGLAGAFKTSVPRGYKLLNMGERAQNLPQTMRGRNLKMLDLSKGWKIHASDADTLELKRGGMRGMFLSMFRQNKPFSIRLAGIDAPEIDHPGTGNSRGYHSPQPGAQEAIAVINELLAQRGKKQLYYDPENTTYGRSVGAMFVGEQNINLELVKRGAVAYLPYGKRKDSIIQRRAFEAAETRARSVEKGMWKHPYYQVYADVMKPGGERVTFNTMTQKGRLAESVGLMDTLGMMEQAEQQGFYSNYQQIQAAQLGSRISAQNTDKVTPVGMSVASSHYDDYMADMQKDIGRLMTTQGTRSHNRTSRKGGYGKLDRQLALDSFDTSVRISRKRRLEVTEMYNAKALARKESQAQAQRDANKYIFASPTGHHLM